MPLPLAAIAAPKIAGALAPQLGTMLPGLIGGGSGGGAFGLGQIGQLIGGGSAGSGGLIGQLIGGGIGQGIPLLGGQPVGIDYNQQPPPDFDDIAYLQRRPDVRSAGWLNKPEFAGDPRRASWLHFLEFGFRETYGGDRNAYPRRTQQAPGAITQGSGTMAGGPQMSMAGGGSWLILLGVGLLAYGAFAGGWFEEKTARRRRRKSSSGSKNSDSLAKARAAKKRKAAARKKSGK